MPAKLLNPEFENDREILERPTLAVIAAAVPADARLFDSLEGLPVLTMLELLGASGADAGADAALLSPNLSVAAALRRFAAVSARQAVRIEEETDGPNFSFEAAFDRQHVGLRIALRSGEKSDDALPAALLLAEEKRVPTIGLLVCKEPPYQEIPIAIHADPELDGMMVGLSMEDAARSLKFAAKLQAQRPPAALAYPRGANAFAVFESRAAEADVRGIAAFAAKLVEKTVDILERRIDAARADLAERSA